MKVLIFMFLILVPQERGITSHTTNSLKSLVRIYDIGVNKSSLYKQFSGLDIAGHKPGKWIDVIVTQEELSKLTGKNIKVLVQDIEELEKSLKDFYHSYSGFVDTFMQIAIDYPNITKLYTIGVTWGGRDILAMKISDNVEVDEDEAELVFMGLHHAREWPSLEIPLFFADTLTRAYGNDSHITNLINEREIWLIPCVNPDGYVYCHDEGNDWRKNRRPLPGGYCGVDPNRNYDGSCDGNPWGAWGGVFAWPTTHFPLYEIYCGPLPFSEAETQAVRDFVIAHNFTFCVSYHTYSELVLWPWGYTYQGIPDSVLIAQVGENMASRIGCQGSGTYDAFQASGLYPTTGTTDDWVYGHGLFVEEKNTLAYTVEACSSFHPGANELNQVIRENFDGAIYLCDIADSIKNLLVPRIIPPVIGQLDTSFGNYEITWSQKDADKYALQKFQGFSAICDSVEEVSDLWILDGFTRSNIKAHSGSYSYFSGDSNSMVTSMTTRYPLPQTDSLVFWVEYTLQSEYDYTFVEVSSTGKEWKILDSFNGTSGGWKRKAYQFPSSKSLFVRFRYVTDYESIYEGFYVDDIYPVASFDSIITISEDITDTFYLTTDNLEGIHWYCVKGHNLRGWGDFSELEDVVIKESGVNETDFVKPFIIVNSENLFSRMIKIKYNLPVGYSGSLKIYDSVGRSIYTFPISNFRTPLNEVVWDAKGFAAGIYFVVFDTKGFKKSLKITLIH